MRCFPNCRQCGIGEDASALTHSGSHKLATESTHCRRMPPPEAAVEVCVNVRKCAHMVFRRCAELSSQEIIDEEPNKWVRHTFTRESIRTRMATWNWATAIVSIGSAAALPLANQQ